MATANLLGIEPFEEALFLDNDITHVENVGQCPRIKSMKVSGKDESCKCGQKIDIYSPELVQYVNELSEQGKMAANIILRLILASGKRTESLDIGSGIQSAQIKLLKEWVTENKGKKLAVFIDYDRTITTIEGGYLIGNSFSELLLTLDEDDFPKNSPYSIQPYIKDFTIEGFTEYYVGGFKRLEMLQEMFDFLYDNNIAVILLTNNTACPTRKNLFKEIMMVLTRGRECQIICGAEFGFDKRMAIMSQPNFFPGGSLQLLCKNPSGGRRQRQTRKRLYRRKQKNHKHKHTKKH